MTRIIQHCRLIDLPVPEPIGAGHLDSFLTEQHGRYTDLVLRYHAQVIISSELTAREGKISENVQGELHPRGLRFHGIKNLELKGLYKDQGSIPEDHPARTISDLYSWRVGGAHLDFHLLWSRSADESEIVFLSQHVESENTDGISAPFSFERNWSPAPPMPGGLVPEPKSVHRRYGGDPVMIKMDGKIYHRRLFIGGLDIQPEERPKVDSILNLGEQPSRWARHGGSHSADLWSHQGEGSQGMDVNLINELANWVIERLHRGESVLIHCVAGMNRSVTIGCASLILLEDLNAEQALARLRQSHPWARPDGHHWLALKWLGNRSRT